MTWLARLFRRRPSCSVCRRQWKRERWRRASPGFKTCRHHREAARAKNAAYRDRNRARRENEAKRRERKRRQKRRLRAGRE